MRMETRIAVSNMKYHKNKNILIGIAIFLTSLLLFLVPTIGKGMLSAQFAVVNERYPSWHAVFRDVDQETVEKLKAHHDVAESGVRSDVGSLVVDGAKGIMMYLDQKGFDLYHLALKEGRLPVEENEIVVSDGLMEYLGVTASIGETITLQYQVERNGVLDYAQEQEFVITGLMEDSDAVKERKSYTVFVSDDLLQAEVPAEQRMYRFLFQAVGVENATTDDVETTIQNLADQFGLTEKQVGINEEYLAANYVDPVILPAIAVIMFIIVVAGIITIYSIYFVNMPDRVQEFGRLKAIGATRQQIRRIVLREGLGITAIALPIGLLAGSILAKLVLHEMIAFNQKENPEMSIMMQLLENGQIQIYQVGIYFLTIAVTVCTVYVSLCKPMKVAAGISEMEAIRYQQNGKRKGKVAQRKSYRNITLPKLSKIYLLGNKKNSIITIVSMGITGVFLMVIATVLSCADPRESADGSLFGQYQVVLHTEQDNQEHPEWKWENVIQDNPLDDSLRNKIQQIKGIKSVSVFSEVHVESDLFPEDWQTVYGVPEEWSQKLIDGIIEGNVTYEELKSGKKIILDKNMLHWYPDLQIGDVIHFKIMDEKNPIEFDLEVAAIGDYPIGFTNYGFLLMSDEGVNKIITDGMDSTESAANLNVSYQIFAEKDYDETIANTIKGLVEENELLQFKTWQEEYEQWRSVTALTSGGCYAFLGVLGAICIMNMVNTMINSVHVRKKEIGMMQAIGMTDKQLTRMLQQEGLFYTVGTLILSVGMGSLLGYPVFLWAKKDGMFNISNYHYPWTAAMVVTVILVLIQMTMAILLGKSVKKESLIERIRFSE